MTDSDRDSTGADRIAVSAAWGDLEIASYEHGDPAVGKADPEIAIRLRSSHDYITDDRMEFCIEPHVLAHMLRTLGFEVEAPSAGGARGALSLHVPSAGSPDASLMTGNRHTVNGYALTNLTSAQLSAINAVRRSPYGSFTVGQLTDFATSHSGSSMEESRHAVHSLVSEGFLVRDDEGKLLVGKALKETGVGVA